LIDSLHTVTITAVAALNVGQPLTADVHHATCSDINRQLKGLIDENLL